MVPDERDMECPACCEGETIMVKGASFWERLWGGWKTAWFCPRCDHRWRRT